MDLYFMTVLSILLLVVFTAYKRLVKRYLFSVTITVNKQVTNEVNQLYKWLGKNVRDVFFESSETYHHPEHESSFTLSQASVKNANSEVRGLDSSDDEIDDYKPKKSSKYKVKQNKIFSLGTHFCVYQDCFVLLKRSVITENVTETLTFTTLVRNKDTILQGLVEATSPNHVYVCYPDYYHTYWQETSLNKKRSLETLALANDLGEKMLDDVKKFLAQEKWYLKRGIPWRKTYLLHGPPGCGKSSLVKTIAGKIGYGVCVLPLTDPLIVSDKSTTLLLNLIPPKCIALIEEVDSAFPEGIEIPKDQLVYSGKTGASLSISGFCNALGGVGAADGGLLIFMTSNHQERLNPLLIRPGWAVYEAHLDYPNETQLEIMFKKFFPDANSDLKQRFLRNVKELQVTKQKVSAAMIHGLLMKHNESAEAAVENCTTFLRQKFEENNNLSHIYM